MSSELKFNQTAAVTRCRNLTEGKLKAQQALVKFADEEVTIFTAELENANHQLSYQLAELSSIENRQLAESRDTEVSWERKEQLTKLIDKLTGIKNLLRFQEEAQERELAFKSSIRQARSAFQARLARLEQRQTAERNELFLSQQRLGETVFHIRAIEIKSIKDKNKARRIQRENEIQAQQASMRQQKESEFLRELQLCKVRQMGEINDLEIQNMEEIEEIQMAQRAEEFEIITKQSAVEAELIASLEKQKFKLQQGQLREKQKSFKAALQRSQRKQANQVAKTLRAQMRIRERLLIADNPVIKGDNTTDFERNAADDYSETQSEGSSRSGGSVMSLHADRDPLHQDGTEGSESDLALKSEAEKNSKLNKDTQVLSEGEKEIMTFAEAGNERQRLIAMHHKKIVAELKQLHRSTVSQKAKEHRRKVSELLKDHEEEIEQLKLEQAANMKELVETQLQSQEVRADTAVSQNLLGMMLPAHIMEKMELGVQPEPEQFNCVTLFFTDIFEFKKLVGAIPPVKILHLLNELYTKFDEIIAKYPQLYKVETVSDTYMVAAGISSSHEKTDEEITECTVQALKCSMELQKLVQGLDLKNIVGNLPIKLRIGVHSGVINAGIIGTKMSRYCLFGDTVNTASRMCTTGEANRIQVSAQTIQVLGEDDSFEFEERGQIEVKGKGKMHTYWLLD